MNKISCDMCMDLLPLVKDGIASEDSRLAVENHIKDCETCRAWQEGTLAESPVNMDLERELGKLKRKLQTFSAILMMFGVFFGVSLTASDGTFYNSLVMPVIGALGYVIFSWKAVYQVPLLLLIIHFLSGAFGMARGMEEISIMGIVMWVGIYSVFVELGVLVAGLLHFAFRKDKKQHSKK